MIQFLIILAVLLAVVLVVSAPLRAPRPDRPAAEQAAASARASELAELEAAREAKYREILDAELDHATGKLSDADYRAIDSTLRAEALAILDALEHAGAATS